MRIGDELSLAPVARGILARHRWAVSLADERALRAFQVHQHGIVGAQGRRLPVESERHRISRMNVHSREVVTHKLNAGTERVGQRIGWLHTFAGPLDLDEPERGLEHLTTQTIPHREALHGLMHV